MVICCACGAIADALTAAAAVPAAAAVLDPLIVIHGVLGRVL